MSVTIECYKCCGHRCLSCAMRGTWTDHEHDACPACDGEDPHCLTCDGRGIVEAYVTDAERTQRTVWVEAAEREVAAELAFLGTFVDTAPISDADLLKALES